MLKIEHLTKSYGSSKVKSVDDLSLEIKDGEVFGFLGPNGAGKSTTIKAVVGILPFSEGEITIDGVDILKDPLRAKKLIGYVPDNHAVFERLTGREYVNHIANLYGVDMAQVEEISSYYVKLFKLEHAFDNPISSYSHGMKQKISVIAALVHKPKLWILDEPLTGLDPQSAYLLKETMRNHARQGNIVFFSSHILDVVENLCDRVCIIKKGKLLGVYDLHEMKEKGESLEKLFIESISDNDEFLREFEANIIKTEEDRKTLEKIKKHKTTKTVETNKTAKSGVGNKNLSKTLQTKKEDAKLTPKTRKIEKSTKPTKKSSQIERDIKSTKKTQPEK